MIIKLATKNVRYALTNSNGHKLKRKKKYTTSKQSPRFADSYARSVLLQKSPATVVRKCSILTNNMSIKNSMYD